MTTFIQEDFLLETDVARDLYHRCVAGLPIIDYHCHLPVAQIAGDHRFRSMTEIWLDGDHYKWRAMRANGVAERFCTGDATDQEKFEAWARTVPATLRNPLYHWTHFELKRPFGVTDLLSGQTARAIYDHCNELLQRPDFSTQGLLRQFRVAVVCTTDDPADSLEHHHALAQRVDPETRVVPTWRPDAALAIEDPPAFNAWLDRLGAAAGMSIASFDRLLDVLDVRHAAFHEAGCRASDHGLEQLHADDWTDADVAAVFDKLRSGKRVSIDEGRRYKAALLHRFALMDHERGWVQQYHLGALRNTNSRMRRILGADSGLDSVGDFDMARHLARFLDRLDDANQLAKTILYNVNPRDNELMATMIGNFQDGSVPGKMQHGPAWWFLDQKDGMEAQIRALSNMGLFSRFVGMVTDSRSFLSYSRHEYFRRLVCNLLGNDVRSGLLPDDRNLLAGLAQDVSFFNAREYLGLELGRLGRNVERVA
ncbi:MAG TPA: glucuronate isomerase [Thermoanaerobaculia bacterium]|jgi:glucuronate isomerase|nr:glucuronate isomerase [Thermoanaerobaculia bacterium]